jgi:hypothetical protein
MKLRCGADCRDGLRPEEKKPVSGHELALARTTGIRVAAAGFLLSSLPGTWLAAAQLPAMNSAPARTLVAGFARAAAGLP